MIFFHCEISSGIDTEKIGVPVSAAYECANILFPVPRGFDD